MHEDIARALEEIVLASVVRSETGAGTALTKAVARGELVRLARGLYAPHHLVSPLPPWHRAELRARAVGLHGRTTRPLARKAAALVWGIPVVGALDDTVDVLGWSTAATRTDGGLRYWATPQPEILVESRDGIDVTSFARTLVELCARGPIENAVAAVDWGLRTRFEPGEPRTSIQELREVAGMLDSPQLFGRVERVLSLTDGRSESPGESVSRVAMLLMGFESPDLQVEFTTISGRRVRCDFGWQNGAIVGEFDGEGKYRSADLLAGMTAADAVVAEKEREDDIRDDGRNVARWGWPELRRRQVFAARLTRAGVPRRRRS